MYENTHDIYQRSKIYELRHRAHESGTKDNEDCREKSLQSTYASVLWKEARLKFLLSPLYRGRSRDNEGQAGKGAGRMPWHQEPKKDVISCEKPRGAANEQ